VPGDRAHPSPPTPTISADPAAPAARTDRRAFLRKAGLVGAGVAGATWVAPSVLAIDRAFAAPGSCCAQSSLNLLTSPFGNTTDLTVGTFTALATTMSFTRTRADTITNTTCNPAADWTTAVVSNCEQGGDSAGQIPITAHGNTNVSNAVTITFSRPVRNLSFVITDIDSSTNSQVQYQEQVTISWTNTTGSSSPVYTPGTGLSFVSANTYKATSTSYNAPSTDTSCNLGVDMGCGGTVKTLTVTSADLNGTTGSSGTTGREIGIAQIKFCTT